MGSINQAARTMSVRGGARGSRQILEVGSRTRVTVQAHGVASDEQVLNAARVEQSQELFEVVRQ
jgi:hypothetical protein